MIITFVSGRRIYREQADKIFIVVPEKDAPISTCAAQLFLDGKLHFEINLSQVLGIE